MNIILTEPLKQAEHIMNAGTWLDLPEAKALKLIELGYARKTPSQDAPSCPDQAPECPTIPEGREPPPSRIEAPDYYGEPLLFARDDGRPLAWTIDTPYTRVYVWGMLNISHTIPTEIARDQVARDCRLTASEVRNTLGRLVRDKDFIRETVGRREFFRLRIKY